MCSGRTAGRTCSPVQPCTAITPASSPGIFRTSGCRSWTMAAAIRSRRRDASRPWTALEGTRSVRAGRSSTETRICMVCTTRSRRTTCSNPRTRIRLRVSASAATPTIFLMARLSPLRPDARTRPAHPGQHVPRHHVADREKVLMNTENLWKVDKYMPPGLSKFVDEDDVLGPGIDTGRGPIAWMWKQNLDGHRDLGVSAVCNYTPVAGVAQRGNDCSASSCRTTRITRLPHGFAQLLVAQRLVPAQRLRAAVGLLDAAGQR